MKSIRKNSTRNKGAAATKPKQGRTGEHKQQGKSSRDVSTTKQRLVGTLPTEVSEVTRALAAATAPRHFIVFVPGFMGSKLRDQTTGEEVWIKFPRNPLQLSSWLQQLFEKMRYPNSNLKPAGIIQDVIFAPPWIKQEQYSRLLEMLEDWGYRANPEKYTEAEQNVYTFAYDWRQDNRISGRELGEQIEKWRALHPGAQVWVMGHSNGGIVARWYIEKEGGKEIVNRLILLASPWDGSPKAVYMLFQGLDTLFLPSLIGLKIPEITRTALRTFPSAYQLIPQAKEVLRGPNDEVIDPFTGTDWLDDPAHIQMLNDGRQFNEELGNHLSVETVAFLGRKLGTTTKGRVTFAAGTRWKNITWSETMRGDGTVPTYSAYFRDARTNMPVEAEHGDIYVHPQLRDFLRWELLDKYKEVLPGQLGEPVHRSDALLQLDRRGYGSGEPVKVQVTLQNAVDGKPVTRGQIQSQLNWRQALPTSPETSAPADLPAFFLRASEHIPGRYEGSFTAPSSPGYYQLETTIQVPLEDVITLQDLVVIE